MFLRPLARLAAGGLAASFAVKGDFVKRDGKRIREPEGASNYFEPGDERVLKRVVFVRHGQGDHNGTQDYANLFDPSLTAQGVGEARAVFTGALADFRPTVAFVSPLWRTLQTCTQAFRAREERGGPPPCPIRAMEEVREHNNLNKCNHRRKIGAEHAEAFPEVSFSTIDATGPEPAADWSDDGLYKVSLLNLRARARRTLEAIGAQAANERAVREDDDVRVGQRAEVLGLNAHHFGACPPTGTPVEIRLVETKGGWRYWESAEPTSVENIAAGAPTTRHPVQSSLDR